MPPKVSFKKLKSEGERLAKNIKNHELVIPGQVPDDLLTLSDDEEFTAKIVQADQMDEDLRATIEFMKETSRDTLKDKMTVSEEWIREEIICQNTEYFVLNDGNDITSFEISPIDFCLILDSQNINCSDYFRQALSLAEEAKKNGQGPSLSKCLAWIAFAAQTPISKIVPPGEYFSEAENHIREKLHHPNSSFFTAKNDKDERILLASIKICQIFEFLSNCCLMKMSTEKKAILLFAVSRIIIDKHMSREGTCMTAAVELFREVIASSPNPRQVLYEFSQLLPNLCDDLRGIRLIIVIARDVFPSFTGCICLLLPVFVHITERGECAPEEKHDQSDEEFGREYVELLSDLILDIMAIFKRERSQQFAIINMLYTTLTPDLIKILPKKLVISLQDRLILQQRQWKKNNRTDDHIINDLLNALLNRISEMSINIA